MSQVEQEQFIEGLKEDGTLDALNRSLGRAEAPTVEEPVETVDEPEEEEGEEEAPEEPGAGEPAEPPEPAPEETPEEEEPEEPPLGEWTYEPTEETESYLAKYDGDLNKALRAAAEAQSLIGRQGNELGEMRREMQELRDAVTQYQSEQYSQPPPYRTYVPDPDEAEPEELAAAYSSLAYEAVERQDAETLQQAVEAWGAIQPFQASQFLGHLQQQAYANQLAAITASRGTEELEQRMQDLKQRYPDLPERVEAIGQEAAKSPTLTRLLQEGEPEERVQALEELYLRVANRTVSETSQQALRRVAVKTSEEARQARQRAQVAASGRGSVTAPETPPRRIALGQTGRFVDLNRVDEILKSDRI